MALTHELITHGTKNEGIVRVCQLKTHIVGTSLLRTCLFEEQRYRLIGGMVDSYGYMVETRHF